jgi:hypothetical protein
MRTSQWFTVEYLEMGYLDWKQQSLSEESQVVGIFIIEVYHPYIYIIMRECII